MIINNYINTKMPLLDYIENISHYKNFAGDLGISCSVLWFNINIIILYQHFDINKNIFGYKKYNNFNNFNNLNTYDLDINDSIFIELWKENNYNLLKLNMKIEENNGK